MKVNNLSFSYGDFKVLDNISFEIPKGKITTIIGPNGSGKSTLFNLMTNNLLGYEGEIFLEDKNIKDIKIKDFARKVAIVHQYNSAPADITVRKLISYGRTPYLNFGKSLSEKDEEIIEKAMKEAKVDEFANKLLGDLSGGQRQRVWIAMALAQETPYLFLDEPTTYLDIKNQIDLLKLIYKLNQDLKITIVMVLHDINEAIHYSDEIIGIKDGVIAVKGDPDKVICEEVMKKIYGIDLEVYKLNNNKVIVPIY